MSKKTSKKRKPAVKAKIQDTVVQTKTFGYEDMLTNWKRLLPMPSKGRKKKTPPDKAAQTDAGWRLRLTRPTD